MMSTVSVTLNQCIPTFCLLVCISTFLDYLTFDIVNLFLHYGNGSYSFSIILFSILMVLFLLKYKVNSS